MDTRLPYFIAYPMSLPYDEIEQRDLEYIKSMYPKTAKQILPYVEEECARMAYEGSMVYDEYPDKLQMYLLCKRIYNKVKEQSQEAQDASEQQLLELIQVLVYQEIFKRRCDRRKGRKIYY